MYKLKTNRGAAKRFRFTKNGKIKRSHAFKRHILTKKTMNCKRNLRKGALIHESDVKEVRMLMPYGSR